MAAIGIAAFEQVKLRHVKVTGPMPAFGYEPCEDAGCGVGSDGIADSCGRTACPACGYGGTNLTIVRALDDSSATSIRCTCGFAWLHGVVRAEGAVREYGAVPAYEPSRAETVECTCPDPCERDHANE